MRRTFRNVMPKNLLAVISLAVGFAATAMPVAVSAEEFPSRPVRILVGTVAGSGPDVLARTIAAQLSMDLGQNFYVENRPGANGTLATKQLIQSKPDGYTLLFSSSSIAVSPYVYANLGYDLKTDIEPFANAGIVDGYLVLVHPDLPVKTMAEFIEFAKKNPVTYGTPGVGNPLHLASEVFRIAAGIDMQHVPFRGSSAVVSAILSKSITVMFVTPAGVIGNVKDGQLRAIGFTGKSPLPAFPNVPLVKETLPQFSVPGTWGMFFAPAKTPPEILEKLNRAIQAAVKLPAVSNVTRTGGYVPDGRSAAQTKAFFLEELEQSGKDAKAAGLRPN